MSSASVSIIRTYAHHGWRIVSGLGLGSVILLWAVSASAQTAGTSTSQTCTQDSTYCSDIGASPSTTTSGGTSNSTGGSGGGSSSGGSSSGGAGAGRPTHPLAERASRRRGVYARVAEQDQRCAIIIAARIARDLPSLREQLVDRQRCLRCRQAGRRQHRCQEQA